MLRFTFSTPGILHWTRRRMRSPHWSKTLSVLHAPRCFRGMLAEVAIGHGVLVVLAENFGHPPTPLLAYIHSNKIKGSGQECPLPARCALPC